MTIEEKIDWALKRELDDDHLNKTQRMEIVSGFKAAHPEIKLPQNLDEAFVQIVFD